MSMRDDWRFPIFHGFDLQRLYISKCSHEIRLVHIGASAQRRPRPAGRPRVWRLSRLQRRRRTPGFSIEFFSRASLQRLESGFLDPDAAHRARHAHDAAAAWLGGDGAALAQPGVTRRASSDSRFAVGRPARSRYRQRLSSQRIQGLSDRARGGRSALRRGRGGHDPRLDRTQPVFPSRAFLAVRRYCRRAGAGAKPAPAALGRRRQRRFDLVLDQYAGPELIAERIALYRAECKAHGFSFDPMRVAVARQVYVATDQADKEAALRRQAAYTQRTIEVSR